MRSYNFICRYTIYQSYSVEGFPLVCKTSRHLLTGGGRLTNEERQAEVPSDIRTERDPQ
jgi:hypothetical protein